MEDESIQYNETILRSICSFASGYIMGSGDGGEISRNIRYDYSSTVLKPDLSGEEKLKKLIRIALRKSLRFSFRSDDLINIDLYKNDIEFIKIYLSRSLTAGLQEGDYIYFLIKDCISEIFTPQKAGQ